jgi:predicted HTH domain antitoxin
MSVNFKALGGLLTFRYINDVEDMDLEVLQEMYAELEEEYKELKSELDKLKEVIEKKRPEEKRKKKEKRPKTAKEILGDEEIPYEVRMKYIIDAYRKDQVKWGKMAEYAKHLEGEVIRLKEILVANGYTDSGVVGDSKPAKVINDLRTEINQLKLELKEKKKNATNKKVERMKSLIEEEYPLRKFKLRKLKVTIKSMQAYIVELQRLLDENDIIYGPMDFADKEVVDNIDNFDETAIRLMNDLENI